MPDGKSEKYPLLSFDFYYDKSRYNSELGMKRRPDFVDSMTSYAGNCLSDGYDQCRDDGQIILAHASMTLQKLGHMSERSPRRDPLCRGLSTDLKNYCICVQNGMGSREILQELMEAALFYGLSDTVYDVVMECNRKSHEEPRPKYCIPDFGFLYGKQGDRFLFLDNNIEEALKYYRLAALNWDVLSSKRKPNKKRGQKGGYYPLDFSTQYELYASIARGERFQDAQETQNTQDADELLFAECYNEILDSKGPLEDRNRLQGLLAGFTGNALKLLNDRSMEKLHPKRLALLMYLMLVQKYLPFELADLLDDPDGDWLKEAARKKGAKLQGYPCSIIAEYARDTRPDLQFPSDWFLILAKAYCLSCLLLEELDAEKNMKENDNDLAIAYYTSANVFSYMLPEKCEGEKSDRLGKLTVMHLSYMNDPNEGQTLRKALYGLRMYADRKGRKNLTVPYVFVKCFSQLIDYLPMWEMYGDHARGCCLVIDWPKSKKAAPGTEPVLYNVCYLTKTSKGYSVSAKDNKRLTQAQCGMISEQIQQLKKLVKRLPKDNGTVSKENVSMIRSSFDEILGKVLYLFKDSSYSYEQEMRVIYQTKENILHTDGKDPWLFVQTPFPLQLKEVILGPKFPEVSTRVPYLQEEIDKMCKETKTRIPFITLSEIDYR